MEDKENLNNDNMLNSSMFSSPEGNGADFASMFDVAPDGLKNNTPPSNNEAKPDEFASMFDATPPSRPQVPLPSQNEPAEAQLNTSSFDNLQDNKVQANKLQNNSAEAEAHEIKQESIVQAVEEDDENDEENKPSDVVTVRPVKFKKFEVTPPIRTIKKNLDIMQDISMHISVELGRTKLSIKEVMDLEKGSIVELNKIAGEQVEVFVNGKLVAKGEVIVIEDRFGVRITSTNIGKNPANP